MSLKCVWFRNFDAQHVKVWCCTASLNQKHITEFRNTIDIQQKSFPMACCICLHLFNRVKCRISSEMNRLIDLYWCIFTWFGLFKFFLITSCLSHEQETTKTQKDYLNPFLKEWLSVVIVVKLVYPLWIHPQYRSRLLIHSSKATCT